MANTTTKTLYGITDYQLFLFRQGTNSQAYKMLGCHKYSQYGFSGYRFAVWAPNAKAVALAGDFNNWNTADCPLTPMEDSGIWVGITDRIEEGGVYKYAITTQTDEIIFKADPYGFLCEQRPQTASVVHSLGAYKWQDKKWQAAKAKTAPYDKPMLIYEAHLGSWRRKEDGSVYTYEELIDTLIPYVKGMGYTHLELMPLSEHPYDGSWGYQVTGYYAATSRYGTPEHLMKFIDACHQNGIGVIMDWVPAHFPRDAHGLAKFDGMPLYEYADPKIGEHKEWGTLVFDFGRTEVLSFLISNAYFWFDMYHIDGLRVDAVSSMLYRDYNRNHGEWIANKDGGNENYEAVKFLQMLNSAIFKDYPNALMIAEESTAWPSVTKPVDQGGLGFNYKWNMGWMNDSLRYMSLDPYFRKYNHNALTFSMFYAFSENYILPLSHDEVVHGKRSLIDKMYGTYEEKFKSLKAFYAYMMAHPGKKLLFMGGEFGQFIEWRPEEGLDWNLHEYDTHDGLLRFVQFLNETYKNEKSFWQIEDSWDGFKWINASDENNSVLSFIRTAKAKSNQVVVISNFTPVSRTNYSIGVPQGGEYEVILNSDSTEFNGSVPPMTTVKAKKKPWGEFKYTLELDLPSLTTLYLKRKKAGK